MPETIESLYPKICQAIADSIDEPWDDAYIMAEIKPGVTKLKGNYVAILKNEKKNIIPNHNMASLFNQLHLKMSSEMKDDWKSAACHLDKNGKFKIDFGY